MIQVAGVRDEADLKCIIESGADYVGFPLCLAHHTPDTSEDEAARLISMIPHFIKPVLITYLDRADEVYDLMQKLKVFVVQLHGDIEISEVLHLRKRFPGIEIIKSLIVRSNNLDELSNQVKCFSPSVDYFITDTFDPQTGAMGATGKIHDWEVSRKLVELSERPVILAGGLKPDNVAEAIRQVRPAGVDVHTGVEDSLGSKDLKSLRLFVELARAAITSLSDRREGR